MKAVYNTTAQYDCVEHEGTPSVLYDCTAVYFSRWVHVTNQTLCSMDNEFA